MQLPLEVVQKDFAEHGGKMTEQQFSESMTKRRRNTPFGAKITENNTGVLDGRNVKAKEEDFLRTNQQITEKIFNGREFIEFKDYKELREHLFHCLWHYEFFQYDVFWNKHDKNHHNASDKAVKIPSNCANISLEDFCKSIYIFLPVHK